MNDNEAFEAWRDNNFSKLIEAGSKGGLEKLNDNLAWCWQAALVYARQENSNNNSETIDRLNQENKKLREALEFYATHARDNCRYRVTNKIAREALKEEGEE